MNPKHSNRGATRRSRAPSWAALALLAFALPAHALDSDRRKPIELTADQARMNQTTGVGVYTGNVVLVQGTMKITGDKMTLYTAEGGDLSKAVVVGDLATYRQLPEGEQEYVQAEAPEMEYQAKQPAFVLLTGGATMTQAKDRFQGDTIRYDISEDTVTAEGRDGRVRILIHPKPDRPAGGADSR